MKNVEDSKRQLHRQVIHFDIDTTLKSCWILRQQPENNLEGSPKPNKETDVQN